MSSVAKVGKRTGEFGLAAAVSGVVDSKTGESWYRLPAELRPDKWSVDHLNIFLTQWLKRLEVVAPEGFPTVGILSGTWRRRAVRQ